MNTFDGYIRRNSTNSKVLLDGGNAKALSEFIGTISYASNKITYTKADGNTSYDLVTLSPNVTSALYIGASNGLTTSALSTNGNVYLIFKEGASYSRYGISGSQGINITSDSSGNITVQGPDTSSFITSSDISGFITSSELDRYLPLSGGTLKNSGFASLLTIDRDTSGGDSVIKYTTKGNVNGYIGIKSNKTPVFYSGTSTSTAYTIYHSGNLPAYPTKSSWDYDDVYLKLTGGTLSGYLTVSGANTHVPLVVKGGLSGYRHNIQLIPSLNWSGILFGANDVTTEVSNTTTNSYWVGNNNGDFSIAKGDSGNTSVSLYCDGTDWYVNTKKIYHTGNLPAYPTKASWNYDDVYLKLSGGTLSNSGRQVLILNQTTEATTNQGAYISFKYNSSELGTVGVNNTAGTFLENYNNGKYYSLLLKGANITYDGQTIYHSGNLPAYPTKASWNYDDVYVKLNSNITNLPVPGGIYWNPYVESSNDNTDAASITVVKNGVAGGTTLVLTQLNDALDTILFVTNASASLYHNSDVIVTSGNISSYVVLSDLVTSIGISNLQLTWSKGGVAQTAIDIDAKKLLGKGLNSVWGGIMYVKDDGVMEAGKYIDFHNSSTDSRDYAVRLLVGNDTGTYDLTLQAKNGTVALTSDIPSSDTYVTDISFSSNKLLWKKGSTDLTGITIGYATNAEYATNTTKLYASDSPYRYGDSSPYYAYFTYNTNSDNRWYLRVSPATPATIAVDYAYNADTVDGYHASDFIKTEASEQTIVSTISSMAMGAINIYRSVNGGWSAIGYSGYNNGQELWGYLGFIGKDNPTYIDSSLNTYTLIHSGNIGSQSVNYATSAGSATNLIPENTAHYFRDPGNSNWRGGMFWGSAGNESMSFVVAHANTRFQFVGGSDIANWSSDTWQSAVPYMDISSSCTLLQNNNSWLTPARLQLMRNDSTTYSDRACIGVTNGNLHLDAYSGYDIYLNHYISNNVYLVTGGGNVGIGTSSPGSKLEVSGDIKATNLFVVNDSSNSSYDSLAYFRNYSNNDWGLIVDKSSSYSYGIDIRAGGGYALRITGGGTFVTDGQISSHSIVPTSDCTYELGSPSYEYSTTYSRSIYARHLDADAVYSGDKDLYIGYMSTANTYFYSYASSTRTHIATFNASGCTFNKNVTAPAFYASSDFRLKNILTYPNYSAKQLASLPLVKYTWKDKENNSVHLGSIAQNAEEDFAELVNTDSEGYKSLDYATLGAIGVISLAREIVELKKEINELKSKLYGN